MAPSANFCSFLILQHPDERSYTGICLTFGRGFTINTSCNQSINTQSSTEAELVAADDAWVLYFGPNTS